MKPIKTDCIYSRTPYAFADYKRATRDLKKRDDDGSENVAKKKNLRSFKLT